MQQPDDKKTKDQIEVADELALSKPRSAVEVTNYYLLRLALGMLHRALLRITADRNNIKGLWPSKGENGHLVSFWSRRIRDNQMSGLVAIWTTRKASHDNKFISECSYIQFLFF